jgi:hypothetical protein
MSQADTTNAPSSGSTPDDRATSFQAVQGEPEHYNGTTLLVTAYGAIWVILILWVAMVWRKQAALTTRLEDLEQVIGEAGRKASRQQSPADR